MRLVGYLILVCAAFPAIAETVVATRTIRPQEILSFEDLRVDGATVEGAYDKIEEVVGLEARVALYPGRAVMRGQLGLPALVDRNQIVELVFQRGGLRIVAEGRALGRGGAGERIRVMNSSSRTVLFGTIDTNGTVIVSQ